MMIVHDKQYFNITFENTGCWNCLFLNCSDTGEDCRILRSDIQEDIYSNIDFQSDDGWRYDGCPLIIKENLNKTMNILRLEEFVE